MVPGHIDLFMRITTSLRGRSSRVQGDDHAIRGLLQLLGELFRAQSLLSYSEKHGFKIQSSAGQEWQRERDDIGVTQEQISKTAQDAIKNLVGSMQERPRWKARTFPCANCFVRRDRPSSMLTPTTGPDAPAPGLSLRDLDHATKNGAE